ncbi:hypothetical protein B0H13DRAFT_1979745 [Mycena leptocephala]|nr:hypothetical protein B0H13DRAFT_1979745 [Mycena leptocephala]
MSSNRYRPHRPHRLRSSALSHNLCSVPTPFGAICRDICGRNTTRTPLPAPILLPHTSAKQGTTSRQRQAQNPDHTILPSGWDASPMAAPLLLGAITTLQICRRLSHSSLGNLNRASADVILGSISEPETQSQGECEADCYIPQYVLRFLHRTGPLPFSLHLSLDTPSVTIHLTSLTQILESTCALASRVRFTQSYVPRRRLPASPSCRALLYIAAARDVLPMRSSLLPSQRCLPASFLAPFLRLFSAHSISSFLFVLPPVSTRGCFLVPHTFAFDVAAVF